VLGDVIGCSDGIYIGVLNAADWDRRRKAFPAVVPGFDVVLQRDGTGLGDGSDGRRAFRQIHTLHLTASS